METESDFKYVTSCNHSMSEVCYFQKVEGEPVTTWGRARPDDVIIMGQRGGPEVPSTTKDDYTYLYIPFLGESGKKLEKKYHQIEGDINAKIEIYEISGIENIPLFLAKIPVEESDVSMIKSLYSDYTSLYDKSQEEEKELTKSKNSSDGPSYLIHSMNEVKLSMKWSEILYPAKKKLIDYAEQILSENQLNLQ